MMTDSNRIVIISLFLPLVFLMSSCSEKKAVTESEYVFFEDGSKSIIQNSGDRSPAELAAKDLAVSSSKLLCYFHEIQSVKTKIEVEKILGDPLFPPLSAEGGSSKCWYLDESEREIENHESYWGFGGIVVKYSSEGEVISSDYNYQYIEKETLKEFVNKDSTKDAM